MGLVKCYQCNGTGIIKQYLHIANGTCFKCEGKGKIKVSEAKLKEEIEHYQELVNYYNEQQNKKESEQIGELAEQLTNETKKAEALEKIRTFKWSYDEKDIKQIKTRLEKCKKYLEEISL
jgi:transcription elongation factor Elf1